MYSGLIAAAATLVLLPGALLILKIGGVTRVRMFVLRGYLLVAVGMVLFRIVQLALA